MKRLIFTIALVVGLVFVAEALAQYPYHGAHPMYCNEAVIRPGASMYQVALFCGDPHAGYVIDEASQVWIYENPHSEWDFHLTFYGGRLEAIERY